MKFRLEITCDNAAFDDPESDDATGEELARLLREAAERVELGYAMGPLMDKNGNHVGHFGLGTD